MGPELPATVMKVALPAAVIIMVLAVTRIRGVSWHDDLGLRAPRLAPALLWIGAWVVWVALCEVLIEKLGMQQATPWPRYPLPIIALRIAAIGLVGPFSEELVMRGVLLDRLRRTRLRAAGAVVLVAAGWSLMHYRYEWSTLALVFADGLVLGAARVQTRSLWVPVAMHVMGNLFSIWQSLS